MNKYKALAMGGAVFASSAILLAACGSPDEPPRGGKGLRIAATTGILADITRNVTGDGAEVVQVVPDGVSPHDFQLSAKGRAELQSADLVVANGAGLEAGVGVDSIDAPTWILTENAGALIDSADEKPHGDDADDAHSHGSEDDGGGDPHVWMDPDRVARAVPSLAGRLGKLDPAGSRGFRENAGRYASQLRSLAESMALTLAEVPPASRELVTSHDSLAYFAKRFGFEVVATPFPSSGAEGEVSAQSIAEVERAIRRTRVPAIFSQAGDDPAVLEQIARRTGVEVVLGLLVESPGTAKTYGRMMRRDATLIARALRP